MTPTPSQSSTATKRFKSSHLIALALAVGATLWILSGVVTGNVPGTEKQAVRAEEPAPLVRVATLSAQERTRHVVLFGRTEAIKEVDLAAETDGRIVKRHVKKGAAVKRGDVILQLAMDDRQSRLAEAEAKVAYENVAYNAAKRLSQKQFQSKVRLAEEKASLESAKAALKSIQLDIQRTYVRAPMDGIVDSLPLSVGDLVKSGDVVGGLINLNPLRVVAQVSERDVTRLTVGAKAQAVLPDGRVRFGELRYISKKGNDTTRTFRIDVWVENADGSVPQGLTAELRLPAETEEAHLVSPAVLTLNDSGVIGIKAVDDANKVIFYPVRIIADTPSGIWLGGLPETVTMITVGQEFVKVGATVRTSAGSSPSTGSATEAPKG